MPNNASNLFISPTINILPPPYFLSSSRAAQDPSTHSNPSSIRAQTSRTHRSQSSSRSNKPMRLLSLLTFSKPAYKIPRPIHAKHHASLVGTRRLFSCDLIRCFSLITVNCQYTPSFILSHFPHQLQSKLYGSSKEVSGVLELGLRLGARLFLEIVATMIVPASTLLSIIMKVLGTVI